MATEKVVFRNMPWSDDTTGDLKAIKQFFIDKAGHQFGKTIETSYWSEPVTCYSHHKKIEKHWAEFSRLMPLFKEPTATTVVEEKGMRSGGRIMLSVSEVLIYQYNGFDGPKNNRRPIVPGVELWPRGLALTTRSTHIAIDDVRRWADGKLRKGEYPHPDKLVRAAIDQEIRHRRKMDTAAQKYKPVSHKDDVVAIHGSKRCLLEGAPNHMAECLLVGLRRPVKDAVKMDQAPTVHGNKIPRRRNPWSVPELVQCNLMASIHKEGKRGRDVYVGAKTTLWGLMLLQHWAETRKGFQRYLDAYLPDGLERQLRVEEMMARAEGKDTKPDMMSF